MAWLDTCWEPIRELKIPAHKKAEACPRGLVVMSGYENLAAVGATHRSIATFRFLEEPEPTLLVRAIRRTSLVGIGLVGDA